MITYGILEAKHDDKNNTLVLSITKGKQYDFWKYCLTHINDIEHKPYKDQMVREFIYANVPNTILEKK
ncbi:MAG: hypothetical protein H6766_00570 [Candidatus Peribacteria bacterium]|nr:MAG: hypothetical protein H6766_00570 [Candidatus Peribacteria bacterium]